VLLAGMQGSVLPIAIAHGEGRAEFADADAASSCNDGGTVCMRFVDHRGAATERYPFNPNGSPYGITGAHERGRAGDDRDATSGTGVPHHPALVASGGLARRKPVAADLPQRTRLVGMKRWRCDRERASP
jgi:hypothetical protein